MELNLSDLNWQGRGQWPFEIKVIICVSIASLVFGLFYYLMISSEFERYDQLVAQESALKTEFNIKYDQTVNLKVYRQQLRDMQDRFGHLLKELPTKDEMPALLEEISKTGTSIGLMFELFDPKNEILHPFYVEVPVDIVVTGTYHEIAVFISRIARINRIITMHDFSISTSKTTMLHQKTDIEKENLILSVTIKIYRYRS